MAVQGKYKCGVHILWWVYIKTLIGYEVHYGDHDRETASIAGIDLW